MPCSPNLTGAAAIFTQLWFVAGEFLLVLVSVVFQPWRAQAAACAVLLAMLLLLWPLLPESGRWLLAHGRKDEAMRVREARVEAARWAHTCVEAGGSCEVTAHKFWRVLGTWSITAMQLLMHESLLALRTMHPYGLPIPP